MVPGRIPTFAIAAVLMLTAAPDAMAANMGGALGGAMGGGSQQSAWAYYDTDKALLLGLKYMDGGHYREAANIFVRLLSINAHQPLVLYELGQSQAHLGRYRYAAMDYEDAIAADPRPVPPTRELALVDLKLGYVDKATALLQTLKNQAQACAGACPDAARLATAVDEVEAALSTPAH